MQKVQRISRELKNFSKTPQKGMCVMKTNDNYDVLEATILGPEDTPYEKGIFHLEILIPENYPFLPPNIRFVTKVYHPNIDDNGRICLDLIKMPPKGSWRPTISLEGLLIAIQILLAHPNPADPLMADIAEQYTNRRTEYDENARSWTAKYATDNKDL